jgi:thiol-disulfide isomerase/thioredoxin
MMLARRTLLAAAIAAVTPSLAHAAAYTDPPLPPHLNRLGPTSLTLPNGAATTLAQTLGQGRPAIVSFWATWCAPCSGEAEHLARIRTRTPSTRLAIVGINVDRRRDETRIAEFLRRAGANYTQLRADNAIFEAFGCDAATLPRCFIFAADGRPLAAFDRFFERDTPRRIDRAVAQALAV